VTLPVQVDKLTDSQIEQLYGLYQAEWWSRGRTLEDVRLMLANSSLVVAFAEPQTERLVAFCRILTDFVFRATIYDVIVVPDWRGYGIGRLLMDAVAAHPRLQRVSSIWLSCAQDKVAFYEKWGFCVFDEDVKRMHKVQREG
jgi:ribosomal protein S18 acetylase RimI-like enzyme